MSCTIQTQAQLISVAHFLLYPSSLGQKKCVSGCSDERRSSCSDESVMSVCLAVVMRVLCVCRSGCSDESVVCVGLAVVMRVLCV